MAPQKKRNTRNSSKDKSHKIQVLDIINNENDSNVVVAGDQVLENSHHPIRNPLLPQPLISEIPEGIMRLLRGSGHSITNRAPIFDDDSAKFNHWKNSFNHYLLVNDMHDHITKPNISDTENLALYVALANCLQKQALNLIQTEAFKDGQKAYKLLCQKYLGNADAREANAMFKLAVLTQGENEDISNFVSRVQYIKQDLEEFNTIKNSNYFVISALNGLHAKYNTLKTIINSDKIPDWDSFKERLESHGAMINCGKKQSNQILNVTDQSNAPNIVHNRNKQNFRKFLPNNQRCTYCFGPHLTHECFSNQYCNTCQNASHNTENCNYKGRGALRGRGGYGYSRPSRGRGFNAQRRGGMGNRPFFNASRGFGNRGGGATSRPRGNGRVNYVAEDNMYNQGSSRNYEYDAYTNNDTTFNSANNFANNSNNTRENTFRANQIDYSDNLDYDRLFL